MCNIVIDHYTHKDCGHKHLVRTGCEEGNTTICEPPRAKVITWYIHTHAKCQVCRDRDSAEGKGDGHDSDDEDCECSTCGGAILIRRIDSRDGRSRSSRTERRSRSRAVARSRSRSRSRSRGRPFPLSERDGRGPSHRWREALGEESRDLIAQGSSLLERASRQHSSNGSIRESTVVDFEVEDVQEDQELKKGLHELMEAAEKATTQMGLEDGEIREEEDGALKNMTHEAD